MNLRNASVHFLPMKRAGGVGGGLFSSLPPARAKVCLGIFTRGRLTDFGRPNTPDGLLVRREMKHSGDSSSSLLDNALHTAGKLSPESGAFPNDFKNTHAMCGKFAHKTTIRTVFPGNFYLYRYERRQVTNVPKNGDRSEDEDLFGNMSIPKDAMPPSSIAGLSVDA